MVVDLAVTVTGLDIVATGVDVDFDGVRLLVARVAIATVASTALDGGQDTACLACDSKLRR